MAPATKVWTLEELHSLPDDGNKYELVRGELFVTPPATFDHETIGARLHRLIDPYVATLGLLIYRPRSVVRFEGSEVEPDLMVRANRKGIGNAWETAPIPILIVEVLSPSTRRRDFEQKREFYMDAGVEEYWIVDPDRRIIMSIRRDRADVTAHDRLSWFPAGASASLDISVAEVFGDV
jgi:Uma2 family endonuclease